MHFTTNRSRIILIVSVVLAVASLFYTATNLKFKTKRSDLIDNSLQYHQNWMSYRKEFGEMDDLIVVVKGHNKAEITNVLEKIAHQLKKNPKFDNLLYKIDFNQLNKKSLFYLPEKDLTQLEQQVRQLSGWPKNWDRFNLPAILKTYNDKAPQLNDVFLGSFLKYMKDGTYESPWEHFIPTRGDPVKEKYLIYSDMAFLRIEPKHFTEGFARYTDVVTDMRAVIAEAQRRHPHVYIGLTGMPVLEADETQMAQDSNTWSSAISYVGIFLLFGLGFRQFRQPMLVGIVMLISLCISFGFVTLFIGHLNVLSMFFIAMVAGLGIEFGIQFIATYDGCVREALNRDIGLDNTLKRVAKGIFFSGLTATAAFWCSYFTPFLGIRELGLIAGTGVLVTCGLTLILLPALLQLFPGKLPVEPREVLSMERMSPVIPAIVLALVFIATLGVFRVSYDHNLLNLQSPTPAIDLEYDINREVGYSSWYGITVVNSLSESKYLKKKFEELPSVAHVDDLSSYVPSDQYDKVPAIQEIRRSLTGLSKPTIESVPLRNLQFVMMRMRGSQYLGAVREMASAYPDNTENKMNEYQVMLAEDLYTRLAAIQAKSDPNPITENDLPEGLKSRYVGKDGHFAIHIHGKEFLWEFEPLQEFVKQTRSIDPAIVGYPIQYYEAENQIYTSYFRMILLTAVMVLITLWVDLHKFSDVLLACIPVVIGNLLVLGVCGITGYQLNAVNVMAFPLIFGTGVDIGIHIMHDFHKRGSENFVPFKETTRGIFFAGMSQIIGFGALLIANHRGLQGLGTFTAAGIFGCLLGVCVLNMILKNYHQRRLLYFIVFIGVGLDIGLLLSKLTF